MIGPRLVCVWLEDAFYRQLADSAPYHLLVSNLHPDVLVADMLKHNANAWLTHLRLQQDRLREERERDPTAF